MNRTPGRRPTMKPRTPKCEPPTTFDQLFHGGTIMLVVALILFLLSGIK